MRGIERLKEVVLVVVVDMILIYWMRQNHFISSHSPRLVIKGGNLSRPGDTAAPRTNITILFIYRYIRSCWVSKKVRGREGCVSVLGGPVNLGGLEAD